MKQNHKDYFEIINTITAIEKATNHLKYILTNIITDSEKDYTISQGSKVYTFTQPVTEYEKIIFDRHVESAINRLLKECMRAMVNNNRGAWDPVIAFTQGEDPAEHKFTLSESYDVDIDAAGNAIKSKALNEDSVYVQWQDQNKYQFK